MRHSQMVCMRQSADLFRASPNEAILRYLMMNDYLNLQCITV